MKFVNWLQEILQRWACGQRGAADRRKLDMIVQAAAAMNYQLTLSVQDIFDVVEDLDAALDAGLLLLPGFDRPVIRVHLLSNGAAQSVGAPVHPGASVHRTPPRSGS
ncbi:hypothetical protein [Azospirillum palustre]